MKINIKSILIVTLMIICILLGVLYMSNISHVGRGYKQEITDLNKVISAKDAVISAINKERLSLKRSRESLMVSINTLTQLRLRNDSLRNTEKSRSYERHTIIDDANLNELSDIISRHIEN